MINSIIYARLVRHCLEINIKVPLNDSIDLIEFLSEHGMTLRLSYLHTRSASSVHAYSVHAYTVEKRIYKFDSSLSELLTTFFKYYLSNYNYYD